MARCFEDNAARLAGVVELVDAPDSKSGARNGVRVRVPPPAPTSAGSWDIRNLLHKHEFLATQSPTMGRVSGDSVLFRE
jgi:hypothetical protein